MAIKKTGKNARVGAGKPGPGRPPGTPNKLNATVKMMVLGALDKLGGERYLIAQAKAHPQAFLTLLGKILPTQVVGDVNHRFVARLPPPEGNTDEWLERYAPTTQTHPTPQTRQ